MQISHLQTPAPCGVRHLRRPCGTFRVRGRADHARPLQLHHPEPIDLQCQRLSSGRCRSSAAPAPWGDLDPQPPPEKGNAEPPLPTQEEDSAGGGVGSSSAFWQRMRQHLEEGTPVTVQVLSSTAGGLEVKLLPDSVQHHGWIPIRKCMPGLVNDADALKALVGTQLAAKVFIVQEEKGRLSLRMLNNKDSATRFQAIELGQVYEGVVQRRTRFGLYIDLGDGVAGLLHESQVSHEGVTMADIADKLPLGQQLKVLVLTKDEAKGQIDLSTKQLEPTPGAMLSDPALVFERAEEMGAEFRRKMNLQGEGQPLLRTTNAKDRDETARLQRLRSIEVGHAYAGVIQSVRRHGLYIDLGDGVMGVLHPRQISRERVEAAAVTSRFQVGDQLKVLVLKKDEKDQISLSTKKLEPSPGDMLRNPALVFERAEQTAAKYRNELQANEEKRKAREAKRKAKEV